MLYLSARQHKLAESISGYLKSLKIPPQEEDGKANLTAEGELEKGKGYRGGGKAGNEWKSINWEN